MVAITLFISMVGFKMGKILGAVFGRRAEFAGGLVLIYNRNKNINRTSDLIIMAKIRLTKEFKFEMAHALLGYNGPCKNIHGHSIIFM